MKKILSINIILALIITLFCGCSKPNTPNLGNVIILGDSFSTFKGSIPDGYASYYSSENKLGGVSCAEYTWWHKVISKTKSNLLLNSSYSGSTICNTGYDGNDYSNISFVSRITNLIENNFFKENSVNTIIIYGGLNDCWAQSPRGEIKFDNITDSDLYCFYPALSYMLNSIKTESPKTRIIFIIENQLDNGMKDGIRQITSYYNIETIEPSGVELSSSHPTKKGMATIANQIISKLS
jgi:hypothetical protein